MFEKITKKINDKLPGIRRPSQNRDNNWNRFLSNYGFVFENNKSAGNYDRYYSAFQNPYVFRCIEAEINAIRDCGFSITTKNDEVPNIQERIYLENLFNNPQGYSNNATYNIFLGQMIRSLELTGDIFIEVNYDNSSNFINGFRFIPTSLLDYNKDNDSYCYRENPSIIYEPEELIHIFEPDPLDWQNQHFGMSKIDNISTQIQLILGILDYNLDVVENDGLNPKAILSFDKDISDFSFDSELKRLGSLSKSQKRGRTLAVKGATFQSPSNSENVNWLDLMIQCRDTILSNFGIPPIFLGIVETANLGSGTGESQKEVFKTLINGKARLIEDGFNKALGRNGFNEIFQIKEWDIEDYKNRAEIEKIQLEAGVLTINEVRKKYNLEDVSWGYEPQNMKSENEKMMLSEFQAYKSAFYSDKFKNYK